MDFILFLSISWSPPVESAREENYDYLHRNTEKHFRLTDFRSESLKDRNDYNR